jgi:hypothetical protein
MDVISNLSKMVRLLARCLRRALCGETIAKVRPHLVARKASAFGGMTVKKKK